jgi:phage shock protein A
MQLVELLPHVTRLVPVADRYFSSKATNERASETALAAVAEGVQSDLGQIAKAHASLYRQIQEQGVQIAAVGDDIRHVRTALEHSESRVAVLEQRLGTLSLWMRFGVSLITILLIVIFGLLLRK